MGWLQRIFGRGGAEQANAGVASVTNVAAEAPAEAPPEGSPIPPERVGLNGEYDQSGLAKRVAQAFDNDSTLDDIETLWVAQLGSTVVLKGSVPNQGLLDKVVSIARSVNGATAVQTDQVSIG
ncbi:MAG: BON domain-containing protein [Leptolyngbyaceae cyanobacterium bins.59]|nr:BON domain-containing protein [Leptolyngbyaceae cyanobacterium bins.59]